MNSISSIECVFCKHHVVKYIDQNNTFVFSFNHSTNLIFQENSFYTITDSHVLIIHCTVSFHISNIFNDSFELDNNMFVYCRDDTPPFDGKLYMLFTCVSYDKRLIDVYISETMVEMISTSRTIRLNDITFPVDQNIVPLIVTRNLTYDFEQDFPITARMMDFTIVVHYTSHMVSMMDIFESIQIPLTNTLNEERFFISRYHAQTKTLSVEDQDYPCDFDLNHHHIRIEATRSESTDSLQVYNLMLFQGHPTVPLDLTDVGSQNNVYIGTRAGYFTKQGKNNIYIGKDTGVDNHNGHHNIFVGNNTGSLSSESALNICMGENALASGDRNVLIGNRVKATNDSNDNIIISNDQEIRGNHNIVIGKSSTIDQEHGLSINGLITGDFETNRVEIHGNIHAESFTIGHFRIHVEGENLIASNIVSGNRAIVL